MQTWEIINGDCLDVLRTMPAESVAAIVTDPPYGLAFMGKKWDYDLPAVEIWAECLRVLKPGGHCLAFAGTRTQHRMATRIEDAGFEIRDVIAWLYGSGFPKSHNLGGDWDGWGTALKPAIEPITVARKPLKGTVAENVLTHGTGAINVDGCRVHAKDAMESRNRHSGGVAFANGKSGFDQLAITTCPAGRWPANVIHDGSEEVLAGFPDARGAVSNGRKGAAGLYEDGIGGAEQRPSYGDTGSAARFFYCAKASKRDRDEGCEGLEERKAGIKNDSGRGFSESNPMAEIIRRNHHPTVKPTDLMRYLCRLVTPPGALILDPFAGSGSTGKAAMLEGFSFIGIEREADYAEIARARIAAVGVFAKVVSNSDNRGNRV